MRSGRAFTQLVEFASGFPDANIAWTLYDTDGDTITTGVVTPTANAVSAVISVSGSNNTLAVGTLTGGRELVWTYTVSGIAHGGEVRYTLEGSVPFPVTADGVRDKLGVETHELPDDSISLMDAYLEYREMVEIDALIAGTDRERRLIVNALEAMAALAVLPTLQLRLAAKETNGTNAFDRFAKVDWEALRDHLTGHVAACSQALADAPIAGTGLFMVAGPATDPITGV